MELNLKDKIKVPNAEEKKELPKTEKVEEKKEADEPKVEEENETIQEVEMLLDKGFSPEQTTEILKIKNDNLKLHHSTFSMVQDIQRGYMEVFKELIKLKEASVLKTLFKGLAFMLAGAFIYDQWANIAPIVEKAGRVIEHLPIFGGEGK